MNKAVKRGYVLYLLIIAFLVGVVLLIYGFVINGQTWSSNRANKHIYSGGELAAAGAIYDRNDKVLAQTVEGERIFNSDNEIRKATLHTVGDTAGFIAVGVHSAYKSTLSGYSFIDGVYRLKQNGVGNDIKLTIDAQACKTAFKALGKYKGTIGVYNYKTGEIVCMVSAPTYDPKNVPKDINEDGLDKYEGVYLNRFLSGVYTPGSIFKVITSACAIENLPDIHTRTFNCDGKYKTNSGDIICRDSHGKLKFEGALNISCNSAFAEIAILLGSERLSQTVSDFGFNNTLKVGGVNTAKGSFNVDDATDCDLGWAGIGQFTTLVNPCRMMVIMGAIANNGNGVTPYFVESIITPNGTKKVVGSSTVSIKINSGTAQELKELMRSNVKNYYGDSRFKNLQMCGKTGTAEVKNGDPHSWFVGFSNRSDMPYAVVAVAENAGSGSGTAMNAANKVMQQILKTIE